MRTVRFRIAIVIGVLTLALLVPAVALGAQTWVSQRGVIGLTFMGTEWARPDVYGNQYVYLSRPNGASKWWLYRFDLRTAQTSVVASDATYSIEEPAVGSDWIVWRVGGDIRAKSLKTGTVRVVTNDGAASQDYAPATSGKYVVWSRWTGSSYDVVGRNLSTMGAIFTVADGAGAQDDPSIHGTRVAYRDRVNPAAGQIKVKTIGSSAAPMDLTANTLDQDEPDISDHLVAWRAPSGGHMIIRYYNYDTGLTLDGPTSGSVDMQNPQVAGDRILYDYYVNATNLKDTYVWDVRVARTSGMFTALPVANEAGSDEIWGSFAGTKAAFLSGNDPYWPSWAKLTVPSLSVSSVPRRIPKGGRIRLKGTLKDLGVAVGNAALRVERYESSTGKWKLVKSITADRNGKYSYLSGKNYSKRKYRVAYDGVVVFLGASTGTHLSAVSSVRTAWPR